MKACTKCLIEKPFSDFNRRGDNREKFKSHCKQCIADYGKIQEKKRLRSFDELRGIQLKQFWPTLTGKACLLKYNEFLVKQNDVCAICKLPETVIDKKHGGKIRQLAVDHSKKTGKVRGLLCQRCNQSLGLMKESFDNVLNLAKYIQQDQGVI